MKLKLADPIKVKKNVIACLYFLINGSLRLVTKLIYANKSLIISSPKRILIMRNGSIGDSITAFPAISAVNRKYPDAQIIILTNSGSNKFIGMEALLSPSQYSFIVNYFGWSTLKLFREVKKLNCDLFINLSQDKTKWIHELRKMIFFRLVGIKRAIGFEVGTILVGLNWQFLHDIKISEKQRLNNILKQIGVEVFEDEYPIYLGDAEVSINQWFVEHNSSQKNVIAVVIGAKREQNKWPLSYWKTLIDHCMKLDCIVLILGSAEDAKNAQMLENHGIYNLCGTWSINQTAAAIKRCRLVISNDTGPMHLSYAVNTKVIGLFSAWQLPNIWFPPTDQGIAMVDYSLNCSLCYSNNCNNNICMQRISVESVFEKVQLFLKRPIT